MWTWRTVQQEEINRGQAYPALQLFRTIEQMPITPPAREQVKIFCATLESVLGHPHKAQADLRSILWKTPLLQLEADEKAGVIANNLSQFDEAQRLFERVLRLGSQMVEVQMAHSHKGLGWRYYCEMDLQRAWNHASLAHYEVLNFQGTIEYARNAYPEAIQHYRAAFALAQTLGHNEGTAKSANHLGLVYTKLGQYQEAETFYTLAETLNRQMGRMTALDGLQINRALSCNLAGDYAQAIELMRRLLQRRAQDENPPTAHMRAVIYQILAEGYLGQNQLERAEEYVRLAIGEEEQALVPDSWRTYGEVGARQGRYEEAARYIQDSINLINHDDEPDHYLAGYAWRALAQVFLAQNNVDAANDAKEKALELFTLINLPNEVNKTQVQLNQVSE